MAYSCKTSKTSMTPVYHKEYFVIYWEVFVPCENDYLFYPIHFQNTPYCNGIA